MIKLIVCDIEGCLMPADKGAASPDALIPIAEYCLKARADSSLPPLVLCTGRQAPYAECLAQVIGAFFPGFPSVVENGAFLFDPANNLLLRNPLITAEKTARVEELKAVLKGFAAKTGAVIEPGKEICISLNPPAGTTIEELYRRVVDHLGSALEGFTITHSRSAVDITPEGIDKSAGLRHLAGITGIDPSDMLGIGDTTGDLPMLKLVGHPACPANATDEVKVVCTYVANETEAAGVIEIIRRFTV
jgi:hypothetical protein